MVEKEKRGEEIGMEKKMRMQERKDKHEKRFIIWS